jgi:hypothetical protein
VSGVTSPMPVGSVHHFCIKAAREHEQKEAAIYFSCVDGYGPPRTNGSQEKTRSSPVAKPVGHHILIAQRERGQRNMGWNEAGYQRTRAIASSRHDATQLILP